MCSLVTAEQNLLIGNCIIRFLNSLRKDGFQLTGLMFPLKVLLSLEQYSLLCLCIFHQKVFWIRFYFRFCPTFTFKKLVHWTLWIKWLQASISVLFDYNRRHALLVVFSPSYLWHSALNKDVDKYSKECYYVPETVLSYTRWTWTTREVVIALRPPCQGSHSEWPLLEMEGG